MGLDEREFPAEMQDFLSRLGLSEGNAPGSWAALWENPDQLSKGSKDPLLLNDLIPWVPPAYTAIKGEVRGAQHVKVGRLAIGALYLSPGHEVELEDRPVNLEDYVADGKKAFCGLRMGGDALYYVTTSPGPGVDFSWSKDGVALLFRARAVLGALVKGNMRSDYVPTLPESAVVASAARSLGLKWARSWHYEYTCSDKKFRYVQVWGQPSDQRLSLHVTLFDRQESLDWLLLHARQSPEDERFGDKRIRYTVQGTKLLSLSENVGPKGRVESGPAVESRLACLSDALKGVEIDLSKISIAVSGSGDPDSLWAGLLDRW